MSINPLSDVIIAKLFKKSSRNPKLIGTNEGITIEYKQSFGWKSISEYLKAMAAFANRDGGYIIFGIKDKPHEYIGLRGNALDRFESIDNQQWSSNLRECFSPEIVWEKRIYDYEGNRYGIIYTYSAKEKPIICKKDIDVLRKAAVYYRYNSQNSEIDYPELHSIIEAEKNKINEQWMKAIKQIGDVGITRTAVLDLKNGKIAGNNPNLYIDESLLNEIAFVEEGSFVETGGNPALKIVGQVQTVVGAQRVVVEQETNRAISSDDIIKCFIAQDKVNNPLEFIKQICYLNTGNMPVYYYLNLAGKNCSEALEYLEAIPTNSSSKELLRKRIENHERKYLKFVDTNTLVAMKKRTYLQSIKEGTIDIPDEEKELKYLLSSIRSLESEDIIKEREKILNLMYEIYSLYFNDKLYSSIKSEFRYALCWIDEAIFMNAIQD